MSTTIAKYHIIQDIYSNYYMYHFPIQPYNNLTKEKLRHEYYE